MIETNSIPIYSAPLPWITTAQMIEVDRLMVENYHIELMQMMENAGRCLAILAKKRFLGVLTLNQRVVVLARTGGNGGGALVCARRLAAWGMPAEVVLTNHDNMTPIAQHQLDILENMNIPIYTSGELSSINKPNLIIDGIIGYSLNGSPRGTAKGMIDWANTQSTPILALDTPSGIDLTSGSVYHQVIKADATMTLALPKKGLAAPNVMPFRGELYLADISVPTSLYAEPSLGLTVVSPFIEGDVVRID
jgi:NAD(P)H-hydrate epimerase